MADMGQMSHVRQTPMGALFSQALPLLRSENLVVVSLIPYYLCYKFLLRTPNIRGAFAFLNSKYKFTQNIKIFTKTLDKSILLCYNINKRGFIT